MKPNLPNSNPNNPENKAGEQPADILDKPLDPNSGAAKFLAGVIAIKPKAPKQQPPEGEPGEGDPDDPNKPKPEARPARRAPVPPTAIDEEKLGRSIAEGLAPHLKREEKPKDIPAEPGLSDKNKRKLDVFTRMSELNKDRYGTLPEQFKASVKSLTDYKARWEAEHPGEKFNEEDDEHAEFIENLSASVDYDDEDFTDAIADIRAEQKLNNKLKPITDELAGLKNERRAQEEAPQAAQRGQQAASEFYKSLGDDFAGLVDENGINAEALQELQETDPNAFDILDGMAKSAQTMAAEIHMIERGVKLFDPKRNEIHEAISNFALKMERQYLASPIEDRTDDKGRTFVTAEQWAKLSDSAKRDHWTFSPDDLIYMESRSFATLAKKDLAAAEEKLQRAAKARGVELPARERAARPRISPVTVERGATRKATNLNEDDEGEEAGLSGKPDSPMNPNSPKLAPSARRKAGGPQSGVESFMTKFIG